MTVLGLSHNYLFTKNFLNCLQWIRGRYTSREKIWYHHVMTYFVLFNRRTHINFSFHSIYWFSYVLELTISQSTTVYNFSISCILLSLLCHFVNEETVQTNVGILCYSDESEHGSTDRRSVVLFPFFIPSDRFKFPNTTINLTFFILYFWNDSSTLCRRMYRNSTYG